MVSRGTQLKGCISEPQAHHKYFNGSLLICDLRSCYVRQMSPSCNFMGGSVLKIVTSATIFSSFFLE